MDGLNLTVESGQAIGLLGSNGVGKTTLLTALLGLTALDGGRASIGGTPSASLSAAARERIGYVPQSPSQFSWLTGNAMLHYVASFYPLFDWEYTRALLARWKISLKTPIGLLSPGQQQRLSIVRALAPRPEFLVLDEPMAALDPATRISVIDELTREQTARSISIIFSSHITGDLQRLCGRFVVLAGGTVVLDEATAVCRTWSRVVVSGDETLLARASFESFRHVRKPRDGERVLITGPDQSRLLTELPSGLICTTKNDLESVLTEWMQ